MATGLVRTLLEAHLAAGVTRARAPASGAEVGLRCDHVLMDAEAATLVFQCFESTGRARAQSELALACAESPPPAPWFERGDELHYVQDAARRYGVHFSRPGNGRAHHVHVARFAAPGRTLLACTAPMAAAAGAVGTLGLAASEVELAAALAGAPLTLTLPRVLAIRLGGTMPPCVGAHDLVLGLARRLPSGDAEGAALEYGGPGVGALSQEERLTVARGGVTLGARASVFPSDHVTRGWLSAQGREPDWKPLAGEPGADAWRVVEIHLDALEPLLVREEEGAVPLDVREAADIPVGRLVVGTDAGLDDLLLVAGALRERTVAAGVELVVVPGSRQIRDTAAACGALAALSAAGARLLDVEERLRATSPAGAVLLCGASALAAGRARISFRVGAAVGAASAIAGRIADPRELWARPPARDPPERFELNDALLVKPASEPAAIEVARGAAIRPLPVLPPIATTLRGVVLLWLGDRVSTEMALPCGPRVWRHRADLAALADHLYADIDPSFAARARTHGGGFVVAGARYGVGPRRPHAVLALVQLGVRVLLARSFAAGHRAELIQHGVLPLRLPGDADPDGLALGDELEIPGLPEGLERNKPVVVRDLTRGTQLTLHHDLSAREIERVRAGGLLGADVRAGGAT